MSTVVTILIAIVVFSLLIFVHELGHFLTAKWAGIRVYEFALGMGPKLFSRERKGTAYSLRAFPIGGFCAMAEDEESSEPDAFGNAPLYKRILVIVAGSVMNLLMGLVILGFLSSQLQLLGTTQVAMFGEGAVSNQYLQVGDEILKINGHRVRTDNDLIYEFSRDRDGVMDMEVLRGGEKITLTGVTFNMDEYEDGSKVVALDFKVKGVEPTFLGCVRNTFNWTGSLIKQVWGALTDLIVGRVGVDQLSGPVGVTTAIGQATTMGYKSLLLLVAFITVNLGIFNLLPIPAVDGGRLIFLLIELVRRKPIPARYEGVVHAVGFMLLIGLMVFVTVNDVMKLS